MKFFILFLAWLSCLPTLGQRLMWEQAQQPYGWASKSWWVLPLANQQFLADAYLTQPNVGTCRYSQFAFQVRDLNTGLVMHEQLSRTMYNDFSSVARQSNRVWWSGLSAICVNQQGASRPMVGKLTLQGDTLGSYLTNGNPSDLRPRTILVRGARLAWAGEKPSVGQSRLEFALTLADTSGQVLSRHAYSRPLSNDYCVAMEGTARGGYLLAGDGYEQAKSGFQHLLVETDSLGQLVRQRMIEPLGPDFPGGSRVNGLCNIAVLPNEGGYLLSGRADSASATPNVRRVAYLMRVDTALNVQWVYRHPTVNGNQLAYKVRLLPNGTAAFFVREPAVAAPYLVQVDVGTGRRLGTYALASATQRSFEPFDWQWLGDGTLLVGGTSVNNAARWDFRGTPLAAGNVITATALPDTPAGLRLRAAPVPAQESVQLHSSAAWPVGARVEVVELATGRVRHRQAVSVGGQAALPLATAGWAAGVYAARLLGASGQLLGTAKVVIVR